MKDSLDPKWGHYPQVENHCPKALKSLPVTEAEKSMTGSNELPNTSGKS